ncbi:MAG: C40 family peptidase [Gammaproteobacteria bacterium]|nr:C40 family peptidase [Gammaproteobacteria bacterium]MDH5727982.1 C40 family peptidase [Gammaproteobacteria bacterium]
MQTKFLLLVMMLSLLSACATQPGYVTPHNSAFAYSPSDDHVGNEIVFHAIQLVGIPYTFGGVRPETGFDCSGLVLYAHQKVGISDVPRNSRVQYSQAKPVRMSQLKPGDLIFFRLSFKRISHVGIYIGDDRFVHAPRTGKTVSFASLHNPFWKKRIAGAGRYY